MKQKNKGKSGIWKWIKRIAFMLFISQLLYIILLKWIYPPITITQFQSWISGNGLKRQYISLNDISYYMKLAVIASEDQIYAIHNGLDWKNIKLAMKHNQKKPDRIRGASTISQQVAKNVFLWQGRDWIRKGLEIYFTKMIEWIWGKKRILEIYLNVIETGKGIFGVEEAAHKYFDIHAKNLTKKKAATIAACLPNPKIYTIEPLSPYVITKTGWILNQMVNLEGDEDIDSIIKQGH